MKITLELAEIEAAIRDYLQEMVDRSAAGATITFYYSGHDAERLNGEVVVDSVVVDLKPEQE